MSWPKTEMLQQFHDCERTTAPVTPLVISASQLVAA